MAFPVEVIFRNMDPSDAVEGRVRQKAAKLGRFHSRITSCRVVVEAPHRNQNKGMLYHVQVEIEVPGRELVSGRHTGHNNHAHEDVYVAVRDAFDAAARELEDYSRKICGDVKKRTRAEIIG